MIALSISDQKRYAIDVLVQRYKCICAVLLGLVVSPSCSQDLPDFSDSLSSIGFDLKLKKLIYVKVDFESLPSFAKTQVLKFEQRLPHCTELEFKSDFTGLAFDYRIKLDIDDDGLIRNTFVVFDYRGTGKNLSRGGDNIRVRVVPDGVPIKVFGALDSSIAGYTLDTQVDSVAKKSFNYRVGGSSIVENHEYLVKMGLNIKLLKMYRCD